MREAWFQDGEATEITEDGDVPTDIKSYLEASNRPKKWFDSFSCHAAANVIQSDIIVFKFVQGQWVFLQKFVPKVRKFQEPVPLFLKKGHITTMDPSVPIPRHWLTLDPKDIGPALSFLGGGKSISSGISKQFNLGNRKAMSQRSGQTGVSSWFIPASQSQKKTKKSGKDQSDKASGYSSWLRPGSTKSAIPNKNSEPQQIGSSRKTRNFSDSAAISH